MHVRIGSQVAELLNSWKLRNKENVKIEGRHVPSTNSLFQKQILGNPTKKLKSTIKLFMKVLLYLVL